jgi:hypothetical protein
MNLNTALSDTVETIYFDFTTRTYYDTDVKRELIIPPRYSKANTKAYEYCLTIFSRLNVLFDCFNELKLVEAQVQLAQDFAKANNQFSTDDVLRYHFKNWIIRIGTVSDLTCSLVNEIYAFNIPSQNKINATLSKVKNEVDTYKAYQDFSNFVDKRIRQCSGGIKIKNARNNIVHNNELNHSIIDELTGNLMLFDFGILFDLEEEDNYILQGVASEKVKKQLNKLTSELISKYITLDNALLPYFLQHFNFLNS